MRLWDIVTAVPTPEAFRKGFARTASRGPDDSRVVDTGKGWLGFHRLAIMGLTPAGMQPFELEGSYVVCNGEIYGYEALKKELEAGLYLPQRLGLRNSAAALPEIRDGYVPDARRGICHDFV